MYHVDLYRRVRLACHHEGLSHREAARRFGIDRKTVSKILKHSTPPGYTRDDFRLIVVTERNKDEATIHGQERPRRIYGSREDVLIWAMLLKCAPRTRK